ncbi:MAG: GNAT family N-acetyltransferase [Verrucomicrobia bacterium]|nr:MAG: GNAT family N-acetyltransferase [Verrucomicrobiota bacterium]
MADAATIADFNCRLAWETERRKLNPARINPGVHALLRDPARGIYFLAEVGGVIVGQTMITYEWSDWRNGNFWWIQSVYVLPAFRQQGVFRGLFNHVHKLAKRDRSVCGLRLYMHAENARARRTYERLGWRHTEYEIFDLEFAAKR